MAIDFDAARILIYSVSGMPRRLMRASLMFKLPRSTQARCTLHFKNEKQDWDGHEPDTSARLLDVLITATTGSAKVSQADRVLFVACEFWAAARNHSLTEQLGHRAVSQLREAEEAFTVIGLPATAGYLRLGRLSLTEFSPPTPLADVAATIEEWLTVVDEPVDAKIAEFAKRHASARQNS